MVILIIIYQQMAVQLLDDKQAHISCLYHLDIKVSLQLTLYTTILSYRKVRRKAYLSAEQLLKEKKTKHTFSFEDSGIYLPKKLG